ncbi:hypothetical protein J6590_076171 [Homalodisca vitripennis]|nr:hypothetical protein J6590_076171 [Homalodisca vitripennis]
MAEAYHHDSLSGDNREPALKVLIISKNAKKDYQVRSGYTRGHCKRQALQAMQTCYIL